MSNTKTCYKTLSKVIIIFARSLVFVKYEWNSDFVAEIICIIDKAVCMSDAVVYAGVVVVFSFVRRGVFMLHIDGL